MKIHEYNQMMKYLTRPAEPKYEQVAMAGRIKKGADLIKKLVKKGEAPKTNVDKVKAKVEADKKNIQELAEKKQIPVKKGEVLEDGTPDYEYYEEILNDGENDFVTGTETIEELEAMVKARQDEYNYMYNQYKMGKLDPEPGDKSRSRMKFLQQKKEEAEMTDDFRLFTPDEADELDDLERRYEYLDLEEKVQDTTKKLSDDEISKLKELDDSGYKDFMKEMDRINRDKKAEGGVIGGGMIEGEDLGSRTGFAAQTVNALKATEQRAKNLRSLQDKKYPKGYGTAKQLLEKLKETNIKAPNNVTNVSKFAKNFGIESKVNPYEKTSKIYKIDSLDNSSFVESIEKKQVRTGRATPEAIKKYPPKGEEGKLAQGRERYKKVKEFGGRQSSNKNIDPFAGTKQIPKSHMNDLYSQYITGQNLGYLPSNINETLGSRGGIDDKMKALYKKRERLLKQKPKNLKKELENINAKGARLAGQSQGFKTFTIMDPISQKTYEFGGSRFQIDPTNQFPGMTESEIVDFIKNADPNDFDAQLKIKIFEDNRKAVFDAVKKQQKPLTKSFIEKQKADKRFYNPNQVNMGFGFLDEIATKAMEDAARGAVKYGPDIARGAAVTTKVGLGETGVALPFLRLEEYLGTRPKDALLNIPTLGMYEYFQNRAGGPRRQAFAERQGLGKEYASATGKIKDALRKFGGVKNEADIFSLMEKAGIGLTDKEKEAYIQVGGLEFDKYEQFRAERQAAENARIREGLPEIIAKGKDPFSKLIGTPAYIMAKSYFGEQEEAPAYDFADGGIASMRLNFKIGGDPKDKKKTTPALDKPTIQINPNTPTDPAKRDTLKGAGILGAGVALGKLGLLKFGPEVSKVATKVTSDLKDQGMPNFFYELVEFIKQFGKKEKYKTGILKEDDVYTYRNPKNNEFITVEEGPEEVRIDFMGDDGNPSTIGVRKGFIDKKTKKEIQPEYFEFSENRYKDILDEVGGYEDLSEVLDDKNIFEQVKKNKYSLGGRVGFEKGGSSSDKKKTPLDKPTIQIDPNAPTDPSRRDFMEKGVGVGAGIGALATGLIKFGPEVKKAVTGVTSQFDEVPNIVNELYFTIKNFGKQIGRPRYGTVKYELGPYKLEEGSGGFNITKTTDSDYRYQQELFEVQTTPEEGVINYDEITVRPDRDGKLKDVDYGVQLETYREIGEDLAKIRGDDSLIKVADEDIIKEIEKQNAYEEALKKKGTGEND